MPERCATIGPVITSDGYECIITPKGSRTKLCRFGFWVREPGCAWRLYRRG